MAHACVEINITITQICWITMTTITMLNSRLRHSGSSGTALISLLAIRTWSGIVFYIRAFNILFCYNTIIFFNHPFDPLLYKHCKLSNVSPSKYLLQVPESRLDHIWQVGHMKNLTGIKSSLILCMKRSRNMVIWVQEKAKWHNNWSP